MKFSMTGVYPIVILLFSWGMLATAQPQVQLPDYPQPEFPRSDWWDDDWWQGSQLEEPGNHSVRVDWQDYTHGEYEFPTMIARPADDRKYPAVLFVHGRRGLDELVQRHVRRVAARGFVVVAPDFYSGRFIEKLPIEHDYNIEGDVSAGLDFLLARKDISSKRACVYSHTRGGYYSLKAAVTHKRQEDGLACYVSYYPHLQDPNAPEPMQVYRYAPEAEQLTIPAMIFIGDREQYQRRRSIETGVLNMQKQGRDVTLFVYPGVGRGFDFRPESVRTFADDLAAKDAIQRASRFIRKHLSAYE